MIVRNLFAVLLVFFFALKAEAEENPAATEPGSSSCQRDLSILSFSELRALTKEERIAFLRAREDESKKFALELHQLLTDDFSKKLFEKEQRLGLSPTEPISKLLTVEEIVRRLVILNSVTD